MKLTLGRRVHRRGRIDPQAVRIPIGRSVGGYVRRVSLPSVYPELKR